MADSVPLISSFWSSFTDLGFLRVAFSFKAWLIVFHYFSRSLMPLYPAARSYLFFLFLYFPFFYSLFLSLSHFQLPLLSLCLCLSLLHFFLSYLNVFFLFVSFLSVSQTSTSSISLHLRLSVHCCCFLPLQSFFSSSTRSWLKHNLSSFEALLTKVLSPPPLSLNPTMNERRSLRKLKSRKFWLVKSL